MRITDDLRYTLAKSFTELAIQNELIFASESAAETAQEVSDFFNAVYENIGTSQD